MSYEFLRTITWMERYQPSKLYPETDPTSVKVISAVFFSQGNPYNLTVQVVGVDLIITVPPDIIPVGDTSTYIILKWQTQAQLEAGTFTDDFVSLNIRVYENGRYPGTGSGNQEGDIVGHGSFRMTLRPDPPA